MTINPRQQLSLQHNTSDLLVPGDRSRLVGVIGSGTNPEIPDVFYMTQLLSYWTVSSYPDL